MQDRQQTIDGVPIGEIKSVTVKTNNKTIRTMRQEANMKQRGASNTAQDEDSDEVAFLSVLTDIIDGQLSMKLNKTDPEYKVFKEHSERGVGYF
jgi:hypothetical protein